MMTVKLSAKFQIVIPRAIRQRHNFKAGDVFEITVGDEPNTIVLRKIGPTIEAGVSRKRRSPSKLER